MAAQTAAGALAEKAIDFAHAHQEQYLVGFKELLTIPSVSTDPVYKADIERCADWIVVEMTRIGLRNARTIPTDGHPVVYGEWLEAGADKPTVLIYAHYDVQPIDPIELWESPPFEPSMRDGLLYARGATDDKSGVWGTLKVLESIFGANGALPVNVKMFFEGEEESGSPNMEPFVNAHKDLLKADLIILCDGGFNPEHPEQTYALRGITAVEVKITGPDHDLHSGLFGGVVHNPLHMVGKIIGSFHDDSGRIQIPGFYDVVRPLSSSEKASVDALFDPQIPDKLKQAGASKFWADSLGSYGDRSTALPTLDVNGMWGGYQGEGTKTVIPSEAGFKVTMRLVADQNPHEIAKMFEAYVHSFATDTVTIETRVMAMGWPTTLTFEGPIADAMNRAFVETCDREIQWMRTGGSIPIGGMFQNALGSPITGLGLGTGDNFHAPNEFIRLDHFQIAMDTLIHYLYNLSDSLEVGA